MKLQLTDEDTDCVIEMAWEDRTPFDAIFTQFGLFEDQVQALMKKELKFSSYRLWRERVENFSTKHLHKKIPKLIVLNVICNEPFREIKFQNVSVIFFYLGDFFSVFFCK